MSGTRRDFIKLLTAGAASLAAGTAKADNTLNDSNFDEKFGVLVDTALCIGCRKCEWACNQENKLSNRPLAEFEDQSVLKTHRRPSHDAYTVVNEFTVPGDVSGPHTIKVQCMHCNDPSCVSACIVGALNKDRQGPIVYDAWKCIGCRYCLIACPFQIPTYEYHHAIEPEVRKCTFCFERITEKQLSPACVSICPNEALTFGKRRALLDAAHTRITAAPNRYVDHVYGEYEVGGTSWLYLAPADFKYTELPVLRSEPIPHLSESIQHGIFKNFVPPLALYGLLGLVMHSLRSRSEADVKDE